MYILYPYLNSEVLMIQLKWLVVATYGSYFDVFVLCISMLSGFLQEARIHKFTIFKLPVPLLFLTWYLSKESTPSSLQMLSGRATEDDSIKWTWNTLWTNTWLSFILFFYLISPALYNCSWQLFYVFLYKHCWILMENIRNKQEEIEDLFKTAG